MIRKTSRKSLNSLIFLLMTSTFGLLLGLTNTETISFFRSIDAGLVAKINGSEILHVDYELAISLFETDRRARASVEDREMILRRLIEEELLVQYAMDRDLLRLDMNARRILLQSVIGGFAVNDLTQGEDRSGYISPRFEDYLSELRKTADIHLEPNR